MKSNRIKSSHTAAILFISANAFAQWGGFDWSGFGGDQSSSTKMEYSEKYADIDYVGDGKIFHKMDIYLPKEQKDSYPVVIHTYGSAWSSNNSKGSADLNTICAALLDAGYAVVTPNHRSSSDTIFPAQIQDLKAVVRFVRGNADKYKFDTTFIVASGFSSGAHLSGLLATTCGVREGKSGSASADLEGTLGNYTSFSSCVNAASVWSTPTNLYTMTNSFEETLIGAKRSGNENKFAVASSTNYVDKDDAPIIMFHGTSDNVVPPSQCDELAKLLKKAGVEYDYIKVPGGGHGVNMYSEENLRAMVSFLNGAKERAASSVEDVADTANIEQSSQDSTILVKSGDFAKAGKIGILCFVSNEAVHVYGVASFSYRIFSMDGSVKSGKASSFVDLSGLAPGTYLVEISAKNRGKQILKYTSK